MENYVKNFDQWNDIKKKTQNKSVPDDFFFLEREIWWASLGVNIGREIDGKNQSFERPILILKKFSFDTLWALPISRTGKDGEYFHIIKYKGENRTLLLLQLRLISINRLLRLITRIDENEFQIINNKIAHLLFQAKPPCLTGESQWT